MKAVEEVEKILRNAGKDSLKRIQKKYSLFAYKDVKNKPPKGVKSAINLIGYKKLEITYRVYTPKGYVINPNYYQNYLKFLKGYIGVSIG